MEVTDVNAISVEDRKIHIRKCRKIVGKTQCRTIEVHIWAAEDSCYVPIATGFYVTAAESLFKKLTRRVYTHPFAQYSSARSDIQYPYSEEGVQKHVDIRLALVLVEKPTC